MDYPTDLKYTKEHEWVRLSGSEAVIGITAFAQSELGDVVFVDLPASGKTVKQKDSICVVESTKAASDVYTPVGGTVQAANEKLKDAPELLNSDPYGEGWMVKLTGVSEADLGSLMDAAAYTEFLKAGGH